MLTTPTTSATPTPPNTINSTKRPSSISKHHPRMMSIDSTSIDLDAIDMVSGRSNRTYSEMDNSSAFLDNVYYDDRKNSATPNSNSLVTGMTSSTKYLVDLYKQQSPVDNVKRTISLQQQQETSATASKNNNCSMTPPSSKISIGGSTNLLKSISSSKKGCIQQQQHQQVQPTGDCTKVDLSIHILATRVPMTPHEKSHRIRLGVCAMDKKARSKPMAEILSRLQSECKNIHTHTHKSSSPYQ
jgi:hypothetical protein